MNSANTPQIIPIVSSSLTYTPFETLWIPNSARFVVLGENPRRSGTISVYKLHFEADNDEKSNGKEGLKLEKKLNFSSGLKCGTFGQSSSSSSKQQLATGDFSGKLNIFDLNKDFESIFEIKKAHLSQINCIDGISSTSGGGSNELVTGSRDGSVKVWDERINKHVIEMKSHKVNERRDCWSVCFGNSYNSQERMIAAGYDNGDCKILDLRTNKIYFECNVNQNGICSLQFDRNNTKLNKFIITTLNSKFRIYDMKIKHISEQFPYKDINAMNDNKKQGTTIWRVRHLPQNRDIWCTALGNGTINLYQYIYPTERFIVDDKGYKKGVIGDIKLLSNITTSTLSTQPIISWNWNKNKIGLACAASLDQTVKVVAVTKLNKF